VFTRKRERPGSSLSFRARSSPIEARSFPERRLSASGSRSSFLQATWGRPRGRALVRGERLAQTLGEIERRFAGVAIQGSVSRWGEVALLAFDPAEGSTGVVDLSGVTDAELVQLAGRSWIPRRR
jgi:hypothetical protein